LLVLVPFPVRPLRLGLRAVAVELVPAAYVERWGKWITEKPKDDSLIRELYDPDVYIGSWEVMCPHYGKWTSLVGKWWLG